MMTKSHKADSNYTNLNNLYQILIKESALLDNLIVLLEKKQKSIIKGNIEGLKEYTAKEQLVVRQANAYSDTRQYLVQKILNDSDKKDRMVSLSNFIELTNRSADKQWTGIRDKLDRAIQKIKRINFENHELLQTSLAFVKEMVRVFIPKEKDSAGTYSKEGRVSESEKRQKVLNCQI